MLKENQDKVTEYYNNISATNWKYKASPFPNTVSSILILQLKSQKVPAWWFSFACEVTCIQGIL